MEARRLRLRKLLITFGLSFKWLDEMCKNFDVCILSYEDSSEEDEVQLDLFEELTLQFHARNDGGSRGLYKLSNGPSFIKF